MKSVPDILEKIETATMHLKLCFKSKDLKTAREWHSKLESLIQDLYSSDLWKEETNN